MNPISEKDIQEVIRKIAEGANPEKIILFGSYASGIPTADSDVDLLVVLNSDLSYLERHAQVSGLVLDRKFPMDILVLTPSEIEKRMKATNSIVRDAVEHGRVMYERNKL